MKEPKKRPRRRKDSLINKKNKSLPKKRDSAKTTRRKKGMLKKTRKKTVKKIPKKGKPSTTKKSLPKKNKPQKIKKATKKKPAAKSQQALLKKPDAINRKFFLGTREDIQPCLKYKLPGRYADNEMVALTRDPWCIHTYWDLSDSRVQKVLSGIPADEKRSLKRILRVYDIGKSESLKNAKVKSSFDIQINDLARNWYINVARPDTSFYIEIGFLSAKGDFYMLSRSNIAWTPAFGISDETSEEWVLPEDEYYKILGIYDMGRSSLERKRKFEEIFKKQVSSLGASENFSAGVTKKGRHKFFLEVATDLIVYGRTEPDASLIFRGKKIPLNPDGTFRIRLSLPIGRFDFPIKAVSYSKKDTIKSTPIVERTQE